MMRKNYIMEKNSCKYDNGKYTYPEKPDIHLYI